MFDVQLYRLRDVPPGDTIPINANRFCDAYTIGIVPDLQTAVDVVVENAHKNFDLELEPKPSEIFGYEFEIWNLDINSIPYFSESVIFALRRQSVKLFGMDTRTNSSPIPTVCLQAMEPTTIKKTIFDVEVMICEGFFGDDVFGSIPRNAARFCLFKPLSQDGCGFLGLQAARDAVLQDAYGNFNLKLNKNNDVFNYEYVIDKAINQTVVYTVTARR